MLENIWGHSGGSIPPLRMPSLLPHDLCHEWNVSLQLPATILCCCLAAKSYLTLCDPMDCSPPGSSVHGILQARVLEWVFLSPGDLPDPGMEPVSLMSPVLAGRFKALAPPGKLTTVLLSFLRIAFSNFFVFFFYPPPPPQAVLVSYRFWSQNMQSGR